MFVDVVVCKHENDNRPFLFQAPAWSHLENGDSVIVDTRNGERRATVQAVCTVETGTEAWICLVMAAKATLPLRKVIGKIRVDKFAYEESEA